MCIDHPCATGCAGPYCRQGRAACPNREPSYPQQSAAPESHWLAIDLIAAALLVAVLAFVTIGA
jgi:hypothetical protein